MHPTVAAVHTIAPQTGAVMSGHIAAAAIPNPFDPTSVAGAVAGPVGDAFSTGAAGAQAIVKAGNWLSNPLMWARVAYVMGGISLIIVGVFSIYGGGKVAGVAGTAVKIGKAVA